MNPDDCGTIDPLLSLHADGMASAEEAQRVEAHLPGCDACRESLAWMRATQRALASRPIVSPPADLRARIAAAIAASSAAPVPVSFTVRRSFTLRPVYAAAASVALLGIISYGLLHTQTPQAAVNHSAANSPVVTAPAKVAVVPSSRAVMGLPGGAAGSTAARLGATPGRNWCTAKSPAKVTRCPTATTMQLGS